MSERELRAAIDGLVREIDALDEDDAASQDQLRALADTLRDRLERHEDSDSDATPSTTDEAGDNAVLEMVATYESRHPQLTAMLNDIMTRLASMGI